MTVRKTKAKSGTTAPAKKTPAKKAPVKKPTAGSATGMAAKPGSDVAHSQPLEQVPELKKKELIDLVVEKSGVQKKYAKPVVEAMLDVLGENIREGREMNLQPMGKVKYNRIKDLPKARIVIVKLRQNKPDPEKPRGSQHPPTSNA